jgi:hypothetical protein
MMIPLDLSDNLLAFLLSVIAIFGNIVVARISSKEDRNTREQATRQIQEATENIPTDDHVVSLLNQTDTLHRVCRKLLLAKGRKEQSERETLIQQFEQQSAFEEQPQSKPEKAKRVGVIRRISS